MIRKLYPFLIAAIAIAGCKNNTIEINGKLDGAVNGDLVLLDELGANDLVTVDSVQVAEDGTFKFTRKLESPAFYLIKTNNTNFLTLLLEPGQKVKLVAHRDSLSFPGTLEGSAGSELMVEYNRKLQNTITKLSSLREVYMQNIDSPDLPRVMNNLDSLAQVYLSEINTFTKEYIDRNITSLVSLVALYQQVAPGEYILHPENDIRYFKKVDSSLMKSYPAYPPVISLHEQVAQLTAQIEGTPDSSAATASAGTTPDIKLPSPEGDTISLYSTRGSVVLLDFWASWCAPCRNENPNLVRAYSKYASKGFQIFQVSLDKTRDAWVKGIEDDKLGKWIHVSDLKYWNSMVVPLYNIESIPANYLLDKDGKVLAKNLRGERLEQKLAEIFN